MKDERSTTAQNEGAGINNVKTGGNKADIKKQTNSFTQEPLEVSTQ